MFTKYEKSAEVEVTEVARHEAGAEMQAEGVYAVKNGAEEQVWSGSALGMYSFFSEGSREYEVGTTESATVYTFQKGSAAYIRIVTDEGEFLNPTIKFSYYGGASTSSSFDIAGTLSIVGIDATGKATTDMVGNLGTSSDFNGANVEKTLNGTFNQVGIQLYLRDSSSKGDSYYAELELSNITIDGRRYVAVN